MRSKVIVGAAVLVTVLCVAAGAFVLFRTCCQLPPASAPGAASAPLIGASPPPSETAKAEPPAEARNAAPEETRAVDSAPAGSGQAPSFDVVRIEPNGDGVIAGRAAPGWKVGVESGGVVLAEVTADEEGAWTVVLDRPLSSGAHTLALKATSPDGSKALASSQTVPVAVAAAEAKSAAPETVASVGPAEARLASGSRNSLSQTGPSSLKPASQAEPVAPRPGAPTVKQAAGSAQNLAPEGPSAALAAANAERQKLSPHAVTPGELASGKPAAELPQTASVENGRQVSPPTLAEQLKPGTYTIQRGDTLWAIAERYLGAGWRYPSIYRDNRKIIKNPNLIHPEQQVSVPEE
jgi:nucleoid-associated protein YgaU